MGNGNLIQQIIGVVPAEIMEARTVSSSALRYEMSDHVIWKALRIFSMGEKTVTDILHEWILA